MTQATDAGGTAPTAEEASDRIVAVTRQWLEKAVIGLKLCPFAAAPFGRDQIRYRVSRQRSADGLAEELAEELLYLQAADPQRCETSLLIHPDALTDFADYNQFLGDADAMLAKLDLRGELQVASFHPNYEFAGSAPNDVENCTNRSPYPMLHLLRETSVAQAVSRYAAIEEIGTRNMATLRELGHDGWRELLR